MGRVKEGRKGNVDYWALLPHSQEMQAMTQGDEVIVKNVIIRRMILYKGYKFTGNLSRFSSCHNVLRHFTFSSELQLGYWTESI